MDSKILVIKLPSSDKIHPNPIPNGFIVAWIAIMIVERRNSSPAFLKDNPKVNPSAYEDN